MIVHSTGHWHVFTCTYHCLGITVCRYKTWDNIRSSDEVAASHFCKACFLSENNLIELHNLRSALEIALSNTGIKSIVSDSPQAASGCMDSLLRAGLTASLAPSILRVVPHSDGQCGFCTHDNCAVELHPKSVNTGRSLSEFATQLMVYSQSTVSKHCVLVADSTTASRGALLVLSQGLAWQRVDTPMGSEIIIDQWIRFLCPVVGTCDWLYQLRQCVDKCLMQTCDVGFDEMPLPERQLDMGRILRLLTRTVEWLDGPG